MLVVGFRPTGLRVARNVEIGFDLGGQRPDCRPEAIVDLRKGFTRISSPEAGDVSDGMRAVEERPKFGDPGRIIRHRRAQLLHGRDMAFEVVAAHKRVGCEKPDPGAAAQFSGVRSGKEFLALAMRAGRRDRQHRRDFAGVEVIAGKPQGYECPAIGFRVGLHRGGCQAVHPGHR